MQFKDWPVPLRLVCVPENLTVMVRCSPLTTEAGGVTWQGRLGRDGASHAFDIPCRTLANGDTGGARAIEDRVLAANRGVDRVDARTGGQRLVEKGWALDHEGTLLRPELRISHE